MGTRRLLYLAAPDLVVPDGFALVVRALPGNTGNIYLGNSKALRLPIPNRYMGVPVVRYQEVFR